MNYYHNNMEAMELHHPKIFEALKSYKPEDSRLAAEDIVSQDTKYGKKSLYVKIDGNFYRLNSSYHPEHEAEIFTNMFQYQNMNQIVNLFGFANGVFAEAFLNRLKEDGKLFVYEASPQIFLHALENYDLTSIIRDERMSICVRGINEIEFYNQIFKEYSINNIETMIVSAHPIYSQIFDAEFQDFIKAVQDGADHTVINYNTEIYGGKRGVENFFRNFKYIRGSITLPELRGILPTELPAVIVAAGPSVDENLKQLAEIKGKAVIFAVDKVLDILLNNGIVPDFVVSVDPRKSINSFSRREEPVMVPLMCLSNSNYVVMDKQKGLKILCNMDRLLADFYRDTKNLDTIIDSSGSVATYTFSICCELGFREIVLVGQDLAMTGKTSHAGGRNYTYTSLTTMVEGMDGMPVSSRYDWKEFIIWYENQIAARPELKVYDVKEKGAKIKGTILNSLEEIFDSRTGSGNLTETLKLCTPTFNEAEMEQMSAYFLENGKDLELIYKKAKEGVQLCSDVLRIIKTKGIYAKELDRITERISGINTFISEKPMYSFMDSIIKAEFDEQYRKLGKFNEDIQENNTSTYEIARAMFEAIGRAVKFVQPLLTEAVKEL